MYQAELLDRMLLSIEKTEDAFIDINNRIITNVNARKDRLNMINQRIQGISAKILALYDKNLIQIISPANLPKISTHGSASNHPHQSIFFDKVEVMPLADEIAEGAQENDEHNNSDMPELYSISLNRKLYNSRMQNDKEDLQQIVSGATKDITDVTKLLLSLAKYRAETMGTMNQAYSNLKNQANAATPAEPAAGASQEGFLGARPSNISSVAELMLQDTDTNVYEDMNVHIPESVEFNIRGKKQKVLSKKEKAKLDAKIRLNIRRE